jgi:hypothetical protein
MKTFRTIAIAFGIAILAQIAGVSFAAPFPTGVGGLGTSQTPASGTIPIGNGAGSYTPAFLTGGGGIQIMNASGSVIVSSTIPSGLITLQGLATSSITFTTSTQSNVFTMTAQNGNQIKLTIPSNVSFFTNDAGYLTSAPATSTLIAHGTATGPAITLATSTASKTFDVSCSGSACTLTIPPASDYLASSTVYVSSVNGASGAVSITSSSLGVVWPSLNGATAGAYFLVPGFGITSTVSGATTTFTLNLSTGCSGNQFVATISPTGTISCATPAGGASSTNVYGTGGVNVVQVGVNATASIDETFANIWTALQTMSSSIRVNGTSTFVTSNGSTVTIGNSAGTSTCLECITAQATYGSSNLNLQDGVLNVNGSNSSATVVQFYRGNGTGAVAPLAMIIDQDSNETQPMLLIQATSSQPSATTLQLVQNGYVAIGFKDTTQTNASGTGKYQLDDRNNVFRFESRNTANNAYEVDGLYSDVASGTQWVFGGNGQILSLPANMGTLNIVQSSSSLPYFTVSATSTSGIGNVFKIDQNGNIFAGSAVNASGTITQSGVPVLTGNQAITLTGPVTGSGATTIATTIASPLNLATINASTSALTNVSSTNIDVTGRLTLAGSNVSTSTGANPTQTIDGSVHNGSANTFMRSDAAPGFAATVNGTNVNWSGTMSASGTTTLGAGLNQSGGVVSLASTTINGNATATTLSVSGQSNLASVSSTNLQSSGYLNVGGATTLNSSLTQSGGLASLASTTITGQATTTNLSITSLAGTSGCLSVSGTGLVTTSTCSGGSGGGSIVTSTAVTTGYYPFWGTSNGLTGTSSIEALGGGNNTSTGVLGNLFVGGASTSSYGLAVQPTAASTDQTALFQDNGGAGGKTRVVIRENAQSGDSIFQIQNGSGTVEADIWANNGSAYFNATELQTGASLAGNNSGFAVNNVGQIDVRGDAGSLGWSNGSNAQSGIDTQLDRASAGIVEVDNGSAGTLRDLNLRSLNPTNTSNVGVWTAAATSSLDVAGSVGSLATTTATSTTLGNAELYVFNDSTAATGTLPLVSASQNREYEIKNIGTATTTLITGTSTNFIFGLGTSTTMTISPGGHAVRLHNDSTYWEVISTY